MKLKSLMEHKPLDFNQPFLSVRRVSSLKANEPVRTDHRWPPLPVYNSDSISGQVRNPGNVPFLWEHAPGRPKDGRKSLTIASESPSAALKHPPRTSSDSKQQHCSQGSTSEFPNSKRIVKVKTLRERIERDLSSDSEDGGDETYLEANDTLSRTESFSMKCSVTGLSGLDGGDVKPSGSFLKDQQTHDFMMGRFLPAAKALASETPQIAHHRKQSVQRVESSKPQIKPQRRGRTKFCELLANESSTSPVVVIEKTLHIDSACNMKYRSSNSSSGDTKGITEFLVDDLDKATSNETKEILHLNAEVETKRLSSTSIESMHSCLSYYDANSNPKATNFEVDLIRDETELSKAKARDERKNNCGSDHKKSSEEESSDDSFHDFISSTSSEASKWRSLHLESKLSKGSDSEGKINLETTRRPKSSLPISSQLALAPPLPKSPSESWLKRTLPSIVSRHSTKQSTLGGRICATRKNFVF